MKISDYKNEEALDLLCDILEPTSKIFGDPKLLAIMNSKATKIEAVRFAIKNHKAEVIQILARLENIPVKEYSCNLITITMSLLDILNDEELADFFTSQLQMTEGASSGQATDNTKGQGK